MSSTRRGISGPKMPMDRMHYYYLNFTSKGNIERFNEAVSHFKKLRAALLLFEYNELARQINVVVRRQFHIDYMQGYKHREFIAKIQPKTASLLWSGKDRYSTLQIETFLKDMEINKNFIHHISGNSSGMLSTKELVDALRDDEVITVGLFGDNFARMVSELVNASKIALFEDDLFSDLVIVYVSEGSDYLYEIQDDLAKMLGLAFKETESFSDRANLLRKRLTCTGRILIILDGVSKKFDLEAVGIPAKEGDHHNFCKVVIVSKEDRVCKEMEAQEIIHIPGFDNKKWDVFTQSTGNWVQYAGATSIAYLLADKCGDESTKLAEDVEAWIKEIKCGDEPTKLAEDVEAWIKKIEGSVSTNDPQKQIVKADHRIKIDRH